MKYEHYIAKLEQAVIEQIESDYRNEDYSALSELLSTIPAKALEAYLSDWRLEELEKQVENGEKEVDKC